MVSHYCWLSIFYSHSSWYLRDILSSWPCRCSGYSGFCGLFGWLISSQCTVFTTVFLSYILRAKLLIFVDSNISTSGCSPYSSFSNTLWPGPLVLSFLLSLIWLISLLSYINLFIYKIFPIFSFIVPKFFGQKHDLWQVTKHNLLV